MEITNKLSRNDDSILTLYSLYFIITPFYLWSSGLPQIGDILLVITMILYLFQNKFELRYRSKTKFFLLLIFVLLCWIISVNLIWAFILQKETSFFRPIMFYLYNFMVVLLTISLFTQHGKIFLNKIARTILISITIQIILFFISGNYTGQRATGTFNNPNQLGYYAIFVSGFLMFINNYIKIKTKYFIIGIIFSGVLVLASLSNAAIISWSILYISYLFTKTKNKKQRKTILVITAILCIASVSIYMNTTIIQDNLFFQAIENRLIQTKDKIDGSSSVRGYDRITDYPQYWIFGAGEGEYQRFTGHGGELHSTIGTIQASYGLVGSMIFFFIIISSTKSGFYKKNYIIFSILLYGLSHNGLRDSMFWILLSIMACSSEFDEKEKIYG